jgi:hypothetical protein
MGCPNCNDGSQTPVLGADTLSVERKCRAGWRRRHSDSISRPIEAERRGGGRVGLPAPITDCPERCHISHLAAPSPNMEDDAWIMPRRQLDKRWSEEIEVKLETKAD